MTAPSPAKGILVLGRGRTGKTFITAHLAMAFNYLGAKTLVVGCDQKRDTLRAICEKTAPSLMEALETKDFGYSELDPAEVVVPISEYIDAMELGPSQLLSGHYGAVLDEAFHYFRVHRLLERYRNVVYDVTDERFDGALAPLFRRAKSAIAVTDESVESLFVLNRLFRASLIGGHEFGYPVVILGVVNNRSRDTISFDRYVELTRCFPLLTVPALPELDHLRPFHRTLFALKSLSPELARIQDGFVKIADMLRGDPMNLYPVTPLDDEEIWKLAPAVTLPS